MFTNEWLGKSLSGRWVIPGVTLDRYGEMISNSPSL